MRQLTVSFTRTPGLVALQKAIARLASVLVPNSEDTGGLEAAIRGSAQQLFAF